uniref:Uncharacterized protein n=1 Tax=Chromera velia CCMP2878 TaxID=1169474 RepID=A0A0G4HYZ4_9ALVE|eukprot:Cvel_9609.t1-p1 / transcript=Cvel_9609.t1 / gene=Cvel_9609 / organism=Chromera_velia_CCMP2878 / gene_product=hypothetical protein / transcript_product=hypothetical protein / location=Cvel_scaffold558:42686-49558(-) / protein_length=341 / sequence_SO=supercontig / SO=protein_coding / is_pseudo=false
MVPTLEEHEALRVWGWATTQMQTGAGPCGRLERSSKCSKVTESSLGPEGATWELLQAALHTSSVLTDERDPARGSSIPPTAWALSNRVRNRLAHAYFGNTSIRQHHFVPNPGGSPFCEFCAATTPEQRQCVERQVPQADRGLVPMPLLPICPAGESTVEGGSAGADLCLGAVRQSEFLEDLSQHRKFDVGKGEVIEFSNVDQLLKYFVGKSTKDLLVLDLSERIQDVGDETVFIDVVLLFGRVTKKLIQPLMNGVVGENETRANNGEAVLVHLVTMIREELNAKGDLAFDLEGEKTVLLSECVGNVLGKHTPIQQSLDITVHLRVLELVEADLHFIPPTLV